jgi:hypothetical protein
VTEPGKAPSRVVTTNPPQGWFLTVDGAGREHYAADYGRERDLGPHTLEQIVEHHGPWRPVVPPSDADCSEIESVFDACGRKSVATLCAALEELFYQLREGFGGLNAPDSFEYARRTLLMGREGSWESELLMELIWFGNGLNLDPPHRRMDNSIEGRRRRGPNKRVDVDGRGRLVAVLDRWVRGPDSYVEVAETLASIVAHYADERHGEHGWKAIADQYLCQLRDVTTMGPDDLQAYYKRNQDAIGCYRLLYGLSQHVNPKVF